MDVYEAVTSRRAVRGFKDEPVSREVLERVLSAAAWSPSGSNIQPWNTYVLTGAPLAELKTRAVVANGRSGYGASCGGHILRARPAISGRCG
jgi:nitroreductase